MGILTDETCTWFQKSMQLQIITATTTQNAREIRDFSSCIGRLFTHMKAQNLIANNVNVIDLPTKSPDLNRIENIWDELNRRVKTTGAIITTLNQLRAKLFYEGNSLPHNYV